MSNKKIRRFPSGAVRGDNTNRPKPHWVSPYGVEEISMVLVDNQNDFGAMNYTLGMPEEVCLESLCRHVEECKEYWFLYQNTKDDSFYQKFRLSMRAAGFNTISALHTIVLKERGYYKEIYDKTELIDLNNNDNHIKTYTAIDKEGLTYTVIDKEGLMYDIHKSEEDALKTIKALERFDEISGKYRQGYYKIKVD
jgi:hypothetical protein